MTLVDRYLQAVKFWLPRNQKDDIIAELAEDLRSQVEEKESELGHNLSEAEIEPILKHSGSPMVVAQRYLPQRSLIGPALFPIYRMVVRSLFLYFLLPWLLLWLGLTIFSPGYRAAHPGGELFATLDAWWLACTYSLFFCTLAFALLDRSQLGARAVNNWNPRALPVERDYTKISRGATVVELTTSVAALAVWFDLGAFRRVFHLGDVIVTLSHSWPYLFWALTVLSLTGIGLACLNLLHPRWTPFNASLRLGLDCYMWGLAYLVCRVSLLQSLEGGGLSPADAAEAVAKFHSWLASGAVWIAVIGIVTLLFDVRRVVRAGRQG